jgi:hypothetical protein
LSRDGNAVFVKGVADVKPVQETLRSEAQNGELDSGIESVIKRGKIKSNFSQSFQPSE